MRTKCLIADSIAAESRRTHRAGARLGMLDPAPQRAPWLVPALEAIRRRLGRIHLPKGQPAVTRPISVEPG